MSGRRTAILPPPVWAYLKDRMAFYAPSARPPNACRRGLGPLAFARAPVVSPPMPTDQSPPRPPMTVGVVRGKETESTHQIHAVIARDDGSLVAWHGDPQRRTFPRSTVKAIQALVLLESGAADRFGFTPAELALACSSHAGTPLHVRDGVRRALDDEARVRPPERGAELEARARGVVPRGGGQLDRRVRIEVRPAQG